jgi:hypothetical protein
MQKPNRDPVAKCTKALVLAAKALEVVALLALPVDELASLNRLGSGSGIASKSSLRCTLRANYSTRKWANNSQKKESCCGGGSTKVKWAKETKALIFSFILSLLFYVHAVLRRIIFSIAIC